MEKIREVNTKTGSLARVVKYMNLNQNSSSKSIQ